MENMPNARRFLAMSDEDLIANFIIPARNWIQKGKASRGGAVAFQPCSKPKAMAIERCRRQPKRRSRRRHYSEQRAQCV